MEYTIKKLAHISGVTPRTLRYYDQIGLLHPARISTGGYRIYEAAQTDRLQQILFYRELGVGLEDIGRILDAPDFDREQALKDHLDALLDKKARIDALIQNVTKTLCTLKGESIMSDNEKFEGFKQKIVEENEMKYGAEIREKYGDASIDAANDKIKGMDEGAWDDAQALSKALDEALKAAVKTGDASGSAAQKVCEMHKKWLCMFWKDGTYTKQKHLGLARMYCADERFKKHYDDLAPNGAEFLLKAMEIYCK